MVIYIPKESSDPLPTLTPQPTRTPAPAAGSGTPTGPLPEAGVIINSVIGVGEIATEHVFISRTGSGQLSMAGWQLEDEDGMHLYFPQLDLFEGGAVNVWTTSVRQPWSTCIGGNKIRLGTRRKSDITG